MIGLIATVAIIVALIPVMAASANDMGKIGEYRTISAGSNHTVAIDASGDLWAWGSNENGQLGVGTTEKEYSPVKIMENVASISAGDDYTAVIKTDGSLWIWGGILMVSLAMVLKKINIVR